MDIDFNELFTTKSNIIVEFEKYSEDLFKIIDLNIKDHDGMENYSLNQLNKNRITYHKVI